MYAGHLGFALAGKGARSDTPLWLLVFAAQGCDWVQAVACTRNAETSAMWSHSVPAVLLIALACAAVGFARTGSGGVAVTAGCIAMSHVLADYVTGVKPTWPGGPVVGLDLYGRPALDFLVESVVIVAGWLWYRRSLPADRRSDRLSKFLVIGLVGGQLLGVAKHLLFPLAPKCY